MLWCHVLPVVCGRASLSALEVGLGRRLQHSNTHIPGSCQPGIKEATWLFPAPGKVPFSLMLSRGFMASCVRIERQSRGQGEAEGAAGASLE